MTLSEKFLEDPAKKVFHVFECGKAVKLDILTADVLDHYLLIGSGMFLFPYFFLEDCKLIRFLF